MADMTGLFVSLGTGGTKYSGTDDHIYIGVFGKGGGSEFPLDVRGFNDFETGTSIDYWFGEVWEGGILNSAKKPYEADKWNSPERRSIDLEMVDYVYLRKQGYRLQDFKGTDDDDAYKLNNVEVRLYGASSPQKRTFVNTGTRYGLWLGNEYGLRVWLTER